MKPEGRGFFGPTSPSGKKFVTDELMRSRWGERAESNLSKIKEAVAPVQGQRLVSEGAYIDATYYAISAGITETRKKSGADSAVT